MIRDSDRQERHREVTTLGGRASVRDGGQATARCQWPSAPACKRAALGCFAVHRMFGLPDQLPFGASVPLCAPHGLRYVRSALREIGRLAAPRDPARKGAAG